MISNGVPQEIVFRWCYISLRKDHLKRLNFLILAAGFLLLGYAEVSGNELTPAQIAARAMPAVVLIKSAGPSGEQNGSGFIVDSSGTIVTNLHVIAGAKTLGVKLGNGDVYEQVKVRAYDEQKDLAIIQISGFGLPTIELGDSGAVRVGDRVVLIGNPLGLEGSVSTGVVSGLRLLSSGLATIQTDAAANPGNSGGPLIDSTGKAVGVLSFKVKGAEKLNFVIPINYARGMLAAKDFLSVEAFAEKLGKPLDLFTREQKPAFPKKWKSVKSGSTEIIRVDGDNIHIEHVLPERSKQMGDFQITELKKVDNRYVGTSRNRFTCVYQTFWSGPEWKTCSFEQKCVITMFTPTRIEGSIAPGRNSEFNCRKCSPGTKNTDYMEPFAWIPEQVQ